MQQPKVNPYIMLAVGVASVSVSAILVKLSSAPSGVIAFYRLFFTVLIMVPLFMRNNLTELRTIIKSDLIFSVLSGIFLAFHFILWFESLNYTSVASSTVLVTLQPIFAFAGAYLFFKERFSVMTITSALIAVTGSLIISWGDFRISGMALWGDFLAVTGCALVTAYLMFGQSVRQRLSSTTYTFLVYSISSITLFMYVIFAGEPLGPYSASDWVLFVLLAVFPNLLGHSLFNWSLKWLSASTISMAILLEPVGASVLAYFILQEKIQWTQVIGGFVILSGLAMFLNEAKIRRKMSKQPSYKEDLT
jgi:drug/metabolite transporter (DMT)-like permease